MDIHGLTVTNDGCYMPVGHKLNKDGYCRVPDHRRKLKNGKYARVFLHRLVWEEANGKVPKGYSLHHTCRNRACCNTEHLVLITKSEHAALHNNLRSSNRMMTAKEYWKHTHCTGTALASLFGVSFSIGCRWIKKWRAE